MSISRHVFYSRNMTKESSSREILSQCAEEFENLLLKSYIRTSTELKNSIGSSKFIFSSKSNAKEDYGDTDVTKGTKEILGFKQIDMEKNMEKKAKRRPGREMEKETGIGIEIGNELNNQNNKTKESKKIKVVEVDTMVTGETTQTESTQAAAQAQTQAQTKTQTEKAKVEINFSGSEAIRSKFPQAFNLAEAVATEWVNDGSFEKLPVSNEKAQLAMQQSLRKAKDLEKKVLASPVTEKVAMQTMTYAMKAQDLITKLKSKVSKK